MNHNQYGKDPALTSFIDEIAAVCEKHRMSLAHEDGNGFVVEDFSAANMDWLRAAHDDRTQASTPGATEPQNTQE